MRPRVDRRHAKTVREVRIFIRWLVMAVLVFLVANIAIGNSQMVIFHFWPLGVAIVPLWLVLMSGIVIGLLMGGVIFFARMLTMEIKTSRMQRKLKTMEKNAAQHGKPIKPLSPHDGRDDD